jgi:translation initiation factor 6 (eIF-6)
MKLQSAPEISLQLQRMPYRRSKKVQNAATIAYTAKIAARRLRRRTERKIEDRLGVDEFEFSRGKVTRNAIGMLGIISERNLFIHEE